MGQCLCGFRLGRDQVPAAEPGLEPGPPLTLLPPSVCAGLGPLHPALLSGVGNCEHSLEHPWAAPPGCGLSSVAHALCADQPACWSRPPGGLWSECGARASARDSVCLGGCRCRPVAVGSGLPCGVLESEQSQLSSLVPKARWDPETGGNPGRFHWGGEAEACGYLNVWGKAWGRDGGSGCPAVWCGVVRLGLPCGRRRGWGPGESRGAAPARPLVQAV